jgi:hypothetical protein
MLLQTRRSRDAFAPDAGDVQGDVLVGLPKIVQSFGFLEIVDERAFKSALGRSIVRRATPARAAKGWSLGLNVAFTASGCAKLLDERLPPDPAFLAGAAARAEFVGDAEPATNWLPQFYGVPLDAVVLIAGGSRKSVDTEWKLLLNLLGASARVVYRETGAARPGAASPLDHFGNAAGSAGYDPGRAALLFRDQRAGLDAAPFPWMKNGSYLVFRRIEQLVPEFDAFARSRPAVRGLDTIWRASGLVRRGIAYGPEVSELERAEGKTSADRGLLFVSYQTAIAQFENVQRACLEPSGFAINSAAVYAFVPSLTSLENDFGG